jgi:O-antigen ligase
VTGVRAGTWTDRSQLTVRARAATVDGRRAVSQPAALAVSAAAALLPFVIVPAWYDAYYWPKVCVLYAAAAAGALALLRARGGAWLRDFGAPLGSALAGWLTVLAVATMLSIDPVLSLVGEDYRYEGFVTWLAYGILAVASAATLRSPRVLRAVLGLILGAAGLMSCIALLQHAGFSPVPADATRHAWVRAWGTTGSPLALGAYIVLLFPLIIGLYADTRGIRRALYGTLAVMLYAALVATEARAEWAALALGIGVWGVTVGRAVVRMTARALVVLALLCAAATPAVLLTAPPGAVGHVSDAGSAASRLFIWRTAAPLVAARPLLGWGPETLGRVYPAYGTPAFVRVFPESAMQHIVIDRPHNDVLQQAIATGLVGLAVYLCWWATLFFTAWRTARARPYGDHGLRRGDDRRSAIVDPAVIAPGLLGGFAAYFAQLQLSFSYVSVAPVLWVLVGALAALGPRAGAGGSRR